ncbi:hypothetical protein ACFP1I_27545 [Dyadobacter subterraneus]|uniref:EF-hand domain-containing protein n=1 Tax=Dyadobacter subterraneus TaxID=2773304 RepID=A0ABR9WCB3_9BACT|nr:hypothetical protein [Dyadobacter subterraneus]MBE9463118.1 hypothetical protein [Dyadobacter subterraneus]
MKIPRLLDSNKIPENIPDEVQQLSRENQLLEKKIQELIEAIEVSTVTSQSSKQYQKRISEAFQKSLQTPKELLPFKELDQDNNLSREELLEGLEKLLSENTFDSEVSKTYQRKNTLQKGLMFILAILLIVVGFAMIIMPAPPSFEIFTVFYFNANDGVTIMDLVSLLIIFGGVLVFVLNFNKK